MDKLKKIYYDVKKGYVSLDKLYKKAKEEIPDITRKDVLNFLEEQEVVQLTKETKKPKEFNSIYVKGIRDNYQIDIIIYDRYKIDGYQYILCVVDVHSRYAMCRSMTNRENINILYKLKDIFKENGFPKNINCDNEFNTKILNEFFSKNNIVCHYSEVGELNKNSIVERFNRTLAGMLQKWRVATGKKKWYKVLDDIVSNYNNTFHRTIKGNPADIWNGKSENKQVVNVVDNTFVKGDKVRIKQVKKILGKGDYIKYSKEVYFIDKVNGNKIYLLGGERSYKPYELVNINNIVYKDIEPPLEVAVVKKKNRLLKEIEDYNTGPAENKRTTRSKK